MAFKAKTLDFKLSPYTGMTRQSWIEAGEYLLEGIFSNIKSPDDPVVMPRKETEVTYPRPEDPEGRRRAEMFEGLARSFFIAAPLLHNNPELELAGHKIREYYRRHVLKACTKGDPCCVLSLDMMQEASELSDPFNAYQQTVETCALVVCLWTCRDEIWDTYSKEEKDRIAGFISGYAHGNTVPQNWRLFNMLDLAFLNMEGYPADKDMMRDHAQAVLGYYAGDGWYRDGHSFDYYSCWAFNVYAPVWNLWYGYENEPYLARRFEENSNCLMKTFGDFFDRDGFTNMWGRSNIYRYAAASAFEGNMMLRNPAGDPGLARRIASGSLLQFVSRDDVFYKGVPTLGFYRQFTPLVQGYSCAESPLWSGKAFLCLHLSEDHPFWTAVENNGTWEELGNAKIKETVLDGPALCFSNHGSSGETVLRTGKVVRRCGDEHGMWNYSKLCFNSKYPWEAAPSKDVESQQYVLHDLTFDKLKKCNVTLWHGKKEGVLYRRQYFHYDLERECHWMQAVNLADFPVPYGMIRADRLRLFQRPVSVTLGAYGFPDNGTEIVRLEKDVAKAVVLKGHDCTGQERQLAMTLYDSWDEIGLIHSRDTNPDSEKSIIVFGKLTRKKQYGYEPYMMISQVITKESLEDFTEDEIFPVREISYTDKEKCGGYGPVSLLLADGSLRTIDFDSIEGNLQL